VYLGTDSTELHGIFFGIYKMATYQLYEYEKQRWLILHPDATEEQITRAFIAIARKLGL
jgi:hypothetical protein